MKVELDISNDIHSVLSILGNGNLSEGIKELFSDYVSIRNPKLKKKVGTGIANDFITSCLKHSDVNNKVMFKDVFDEFIRQCENVGEPIGKNSFCILLKQRGYSVIKMGKNILTVRGVKVSWTPKTKDQSRSDAMGWLLSEDFITGQLEHTNSDLDNMVARDLYEEYLESVQEHIDNTKGKAEPLGKIKFYDELRSKGFSIVKSQCNVLKVFCIKSNWL